jgi:hypothetical protein
VESIFITGYPTGLQTDKKPFLLPDTAWQTMENAFIFRERVKKRQGLEYLGRLKRNLSSQSLGSTVTSQLTYTFNIKSLLSLESSAEISPSSLVVTITGADSATFTDQGNGQLTATGTGVTLGSYVVYNNGVVTINLSASVGSSPITASFDYFPTLPVMGIIQRDLGYLNQKQTLWFDTKYAYILNGSNYIEFIPGTTWSGSDSDFFWGFNYRGTGPQNKLLFVTNFVNTAGSPMRYTDGTTCTTFAPAITSTQFLFQARIIVSYYNRLIALNCIEGVSISGAVTIGNRARCSGPVGADPTSSNAWRGDLPGNGFVFDIPTNEDITSAMFVKNTLVVRCEQTTWQLRYTGNYGNPFLWERVSADFGGESTFAGVLLENNQLDIGTKAITAANSIEVKRIDSNIPSQVFQFQISNNGLKRVQGIRDYYNELIYWNYPDSNTQLNQNTPVIFPNKVLVYNYRNSSWAIFRDNVTAFGTLQLVNNQVTWDSTTVTWDDEDVTWDDTESQSNFPATVSGNAQGWTFLYNYSNPDDPSLSIQSINLTTTPIQLTIPNHNLLQFETFQIKGMNFLESVGFSPIECSLNNGLFNVLNVVDANTIEISQWDFSENSYTEDIVVTFTPVTPLVNVIYIGLGTLTLFPKLNIQTKDFNIYQNSGLQTKLSSIDFLIKPTSSASMSVFLYKNASPAVRGNFLISSNPATWIQDMETSGQNTFYSPVSDYSWFRFFTTLSAQYFNINLTYDDALMNTLSTHQQGWELYAINARCMPGGRITF